MIRILAATSLLCSLIFSAGCARKEQATPEPEPEQSKVVSYTDTSVEVTESDIGKRNTQSGPSLSSGSMVVKADFNLDGQTDMAMVEEKAEGEREVALYIRKATEEEDEPEKRVYFRGGSIRTPVDGEIIGIMSKRSGSYTDLLVLTKDAVGNSEIIHYRNDGKRFTRVD